MYEAWEIMNLRIVPNYRNINDETMRVGSKAVHKTHIVQRGV